MRRLAWVVVGTAVLLGMGLGLRDGSGLVGPGPEASGAAHGERIVGPVTHVRDGDTVEVGTVAVRIANLDCAERGSEAGQRASERMTELTRGEEVACQLEGRRSYDREVGTCALASSGEDLGEALVAEGTCGRWGTRS